MKYTFTFENNVVFRTPEIWLSQFTYIVIMAWFLALGTIKRLVARRGCIFYKFASFTILLVYGLIQLGPLFRKSFYANTAFQQFHLQMHSVRYARRLGYFLENASLPFLGSFFFAFKWRPGSWIFKSVVILPSWDEGSSEKNRNPDPKM